MNIVEKFFVLVNNKKLFKKMQKLQEKRLEQIVTKSYLHLLKKFPELLDPEYNEKVATLFDSYQLLLKEYNESEVRNPEKRCELFLLLDPYTKSMLELLFEEIIRELKGK